MTSPRPWAAVLIFILAGSPALSFAADDVAALRAELEALKSDYSNKVSSLEARISQLETAQGASVDKGASVANSTPPAGAAPAVSAAEAAAVAASLGAPSSADSTPAPSYTPPEPSVDGGGGGGRV